MLIGLALAGCVGTSPTVADRPPLPQLAEPAPGIFTSGRLTAVDLDSIKRAGIREVIDLTLDSETPEFDEAAAARSRGLVYRNLPIEGAAALTIENVRAFDALLRSARRPVLVHCSSGNRVGAMAALRTAWLDGSGMEAAVALGKAWGLKGLEVEVRKRLQPGPPADGSSGISTDAGTSAGIQPTAGRLLDGDVAIADGRGLRCLRNPGSWM